MDIVRQLRDGEITQTEATTTFDEAIGAIHRGESESDWRELFELTNHEATAVTLGASVSDLVRFRYGGWPDSCDRCGQALDYLTYGWTVSRKSDGILTLVHITCPSPD